MFLPILQAILWARRVSSSNDVTSAPACAHGLPGLYHHATLENGLRLFAGTDADEPAFLELPGPAQEPASTGLATGKWGLTPGDSGGPPSPP